MKIFTQNFSINFIKYNLFRFVILIILLVLILICYHSYKQIFYLKLEDPINWMLISLITIIILVFSYVLFNKKFFVSLIYSFRNSIQSSKLRKRIIVAFSFGTVIPTFIIAVFSIYFFNQSVQVWFDKKITNLLDQSVKVGDLYVKEHNMQLKQTAISVSEDLGELYYDLIHNSQLFSKVLGAQAEMRSIDEAIVFQKSTNTILAQTSLSFSLSFVDIPIHLIERANAGEVVNIPSDSSKIRVLIKLHDYYDAYMIIGRLIDTKIIDHISRTDGAVVEYNKLKDNIYNIQIKFSFVFIFIAMCLVMIAIIAGRNFAEKIVRPIRHLVIASEEARKGNFQARVPERGMQKDELRVLASAFNRMISQISRQQKELVVAQKAVAWSNVARQIAHEIKNPLTPIQLSADRIKAKFVDEVKDKESLTKYINNIIRKTNDIKTIVSEFVSFARIPPPNFVKCNIIDLVVNFVEAQRLVNEKITYFLNYNVNKYEIPCDITKFHQILENLLLNSEEALSNKELNAFIYIDLLVNDNFSIVIRDNGGGIPKNILSKAKQPYITSKEKGTGLGLAIVERLVEEHFGKFDIYNNEIGGATVKLIFDSKLLIEKNKK
mgnify:CR=1 FL=1